MVSRANKQWGEGVLEQQQLTIRTSAGRDKKFGNISLTTHSLQPLVFTVEPLIDDRECEHVIT